MARKGRKSKAAGWTIAILIVIAILSAAFYVKFYYVFSDGTKTGELNQISKTGYVFKTNEGVIILTGYGSKNSGTVQSNEFKFSATEQAYRELSEMTGQRVTVHYRKYLGALPWRGFEKSIVDSVSMDYSEDTGQKYRDDGMFL